MRAATQPATPRASHGTSRTRPEQAHLDTGDESGFVEQGWLGRRLAVGDDVVLRVVAPMPRCVMVTQAQRGLPADDDLLRRVTDVSDMNFGVLADVVATGRVAVDDAVRLLD